MAPRNKDKGSYWYKENMGYICLINAKSGKVTFQKKIESNYSPTHIGIYDKRLAYIATNQFISLDQKELIKKVLKEKKSKYFEVSNQEYRQGKMVSRHLF